MPDKLSHSIRGALVEICVGVGFILSLTKEETRLEVWRNKKYIGFSINIITISGQVYHNVCRRLDQDNSRKYVRT